MKTTIIIILSGLILLALVILVKLNPIQTLGGDNDLSDGFTHSSISISITGTGTTQALAANYSAAYRRIQNVGNTMITCQLDDATSTLAVGKGIVLNSSTTNSIYEIKPENLYKGQIRCISETSTGTLSVMER